MSTQLNNKCGLRPEQEHNFSAHGNAEIHSVNPDCEIQPTIEAEEMHGIALAYLRRGFSVVPQEAGEKKPAVRWKEYQGRLPTTACVDEWWLNDFRNAGIAVVLGEQSDLFVIDVDGTEAHETLLARLGGIPVAPMVLSGSGKPDRYHLFFKYPSGLSTKAKATPWHQGLEFRGSKGIVVLPPSLHASAYRYQWAPTRSLDDLVLPTLPEEVMDELKASEPRETVTLGRNATPRRSRSRRPILHAIVENISVATDRFISGEFADGPCWNEKLFHAACDLAGCEIPQGKAEHLLLAGAQPWNDEETSKAMATIASAYSLDRTPARGAAGRNVTRHQFSIGNISVCIE